MYESLGHIKRIESSSVEVKNIYINNSKTIKSIAEDQTQIIDELNQIDKELDTIIQSGGNQKLINYFNDAIQNHSEYDMSKVSSRE